MRGGIDLGGTKIQAVVVDGRAKVLGEHRMPTPKDAGPEGVVWALAEAIKAAAGAAGVEPAALDGVGVGSPGTVDSDAGTVANALNVIPSWEAPVPVGASLSDESGRPCTSATTCASGRGRVPAGGGQAVPLDPGRLLGHRRRRRLILDGRPWHGRGAAGEIGQWWSGAAARSARAAATAAWRPTPAGGRWSGSARRRHKDGEKTKLFEIMENRERDAAHERGLGRRARPRRRHGQAS